MAGIDPVQVRLEDRGFDLGKAYELSDTVQPLLATGSRKELGFGANKVLVDDGGLFLRSDEYIDDVVVVVARFVSFNMNTHTLIDLR